MLIYFSKQTEMGEKKLKVLVITPDKTGVGYYRSLQPHLYMARNYSDVVDIDIVGQLPHDVPLDEFFLRYDVVNFHKSLDPSGNLVRLLHYLERVTVMDIDDYWNLGQFHPMAYSSRIGKWKEGIIDHITNSDYVTTTTDIFAKEIMRHNKNVYVFPNAIDPEEKQFIPNSKENGKVRFGIICGSTHKADIDLMKGVMSQLSQEVRDKIQIYLCGFDTNGILHRYDGNGNVTEVKIKPEDSVWCEYEKVLTDNYKLVSPGYKEYLMKYENIPTDGVFDGEFYQRRWTKPVSEYATHYNDIDVLLVPLKDCDFNKMKSQLKVVEAGFMGKGIIAQNFGPYTIDLESIIDKSGDLNPNGNALLVDVGKDHKMWAKHITRIVKEPDLLVMMKDNLHKTVKDKYSLSAVCEKRMELYKKILEKLS